MSTVEPVKVDQVFIGTSTNGRLEDFQLAASILKGRKVAGGTRLLITPGSRTVLLEGLADGTFQSLAEARRIAKEYGCGLVVTEMVSAEGLLRKGRSFLKIGEDEHPVSVPLFGSDPEVLAEAGQMAESMGADVIDINMGCPAKQVVEVGAGADLMRFPEKVEGIVKKMRRCEGPSQH